MTHRHDLVVIGGGVAGLRAALEATRAGLDVAVISKVCLLRSHSVAACGGINAPLSDVEGRDDSWERHAQDTLLASEQLADSDAVAMLCRAAPSTVEEMVQLGAVFSRQGDGRIAQRRLWPTGVPRACYARERIGHELLQTLYQQCIVEASRARGRTDFFEEFYTTRLARTDNRCVGCVALDIADGRLHGFAAKAVLLATGGYGRIYAHSTGASGTTGDGAALAFQVGVPLEDMEFVQFHPVTLAGTNVFIPLEAIVAGGHLLNSRGERVMTASASSRSEFPPADALNRAIQEEINAGRGLDNNSLYLDLRHLSPDDYPEDLAELRSTILRCAGLDPAEELIPVQPAQHFSVGGVAVQADGWTGLGGLYAAGEAACVSVHGARALPGNSLLEALVFGKNTAMTIIRHNDQEPRPDEAAIGQAMDGEQRRIEALMARPRGERASTVRDDLRLTMSEMFGVLRDRAHMADGVGIIKSLQERIGQISISDQHSSYNYALIEVLELEAMVLVAEAVARSAIAREESRGAHVRIDFPDRDDKHFWTHLMAWNRAGAIEILRQAVRS